MSRVMRLAEDLQTLQAVEDHVTNKAEIVRLLGELERDSAVHSVVATGADGAAAEEVVAGTPSKSSRRSPRHPARASGNSSSRCPISSRLT